MPVLGDGAWELAQVDDSVVTNVDDVGDGHCPAATGEHIGARHDLQRIHGLVGNVSGRQPRADAAITRSGGPQNADVTVR